MSIHEKIVSLIVGLIIVTGCSITNAKVTSTQYYIVGDNKFVLIYETNYADNPELGKETQYIVNSFEWNE